jgi:signal transduction histidine kinase
MTATQRRAWVWYAVAWLVVGVVYASMMTHSRPMFIGLSTSIAFLEGIGYVVPVAFLGVGVWYFTGWLAWPPRHAWRFVAWHLGAAMIFSWSWLAAQGAWIAVGTGVRAAVLIVGSFAGYAVLDGVFVYGIIAAGSHAVRIASRLREAQARTARADSLRMRAELEALRGRLNPHFLFNTLHTLTALVRRDPGTAERALERFGDMLRYVLDVKRANREDVTLADELAFVRDYLSLEQLRLGERLRVAEEIDPDALDCVLPSLTLQPIVENAIKHAIAPRAVGGTLSIHAALVDDRLELQVCDDGPGAQAGPGDAAPGLGLSAVRQRLATRYPSRSSVSVRTAPGEGFRVTLVVPAHTATDLAAAT